MTAQGRIGEVETARLEYDKARQKLGEAHKHALKVAAKSDAKLSTGEGDVGIRQAEAALAGTAVLALSRYKCLLVTSRIDR